MGIVCHKHHASGCMVMLSTACCPWHSAHRLPPIIVVRTARCSMHISPGRLIWYQHGAFSGAGAIVASFVPAECPKRGVMWVYSESP